MDDDCSRCIPEGAMLHFNATEDLCCDGLRFDQSTRTCEKTIASAPEPNTLWSRQEEKIKNEHGC